MRSPKSVCLMVTNEVTAVTFYRGYLRFLKDRGWDVSVVAASTGRLQELAEDEGVRAFDLPMRRDPALMHDLVSLIRAVALLRRLRPEVVVAATPKAGLIAMIAAWATGVPVRVYQLWGLRLETERGWRRALFTLLERIAGKLATQVVANSQSLAEEARRLHLSATVDVLGPGSSHGVDLDFFDSKNAGIPPADSATMRRVSECAESVVIGYVGRVHRDKGVDTLLDAVSLLAGQGIPLVLLVVGPIEDVLLKERIEEVSMPNLTIVMTGPVSDPRPYFLLMHVHVLPTRREGFPNVVLEAGALGVPTITTLATGARDSVVNNVTGILVPVDDVVQMSREIGNITSSVTQRAMFSENARAHVAANYGRDTIFDLQEKNLNGLRETKSLEVSGLEGESS